MTTHGVSVVIPVYNGTNYLREAIDSVLAQTYADYEVLVIDDGSTDGTWELIQSCGERVRAFRKPNGGVASALNWGIREMQGRWFAWLSHDDLWLPKKLERQVDFLQKNPQFKACYTDYFVIDEQGNQLRAVETPWYPRQQAMRVLFGRMYIGGCTMMVDRTCFDRVGLFNENLRTTQDVEMWFRILGCYEIGRLPEKLTQERTFPGQGSRSVVSHEAEKAATFEQMFESIDPADLFPELARSMRASQLAAHAQIWFADTMAWSRGYDALARKHYQRAIEINPALTNPARFNPWILNRRRSLRRAYRQVRSALSVVVDR